MAWTGVDRAVHTVENRGLPGPAQRWRALRDRIHTDVCTNGFDAQRNTFTQYYGSESLDAALLLIPRVGFLAWKDPRVIGTVEAVRNELSHDGLLLRYQTEHGVDGLPGTEGAFLACTLWLADALHGIGRTAEAVTLLERLLTLRNDAGLLSEEYDVAAGRQVGNTPQAFSMVGLISTARELSGVHTETSAPGSAQHLRD
jgi:GH15 family glucan-1,4-alpha-glucosidase